MDNSINNTNSLPQAQKKSVSFLLGIGILFFPIIFAWFTLKSGYSVLARIVSFGWLILGLIFVFSGGHDTNTSNSYTDSSATQIAEPPNGQSQQPVQVMQISANQLLAAYKANEVNADRNFKGQILEVSGTVDAIDSGISDGANVQFKVGDEYSIDSVTATGDENFDNFAANLSKGQKITLQCEGGGEVIGSPMLNNCKPV